MLYTMMRCLLEVLLDTKQGWFSFAFGGLLATLLLPPLLSNDNHDNHQGEVEEDGEEGSACYVYKGRPGETVPKTVVHVVIQESVRVIRAYAFANCPKLESVDFSSNNGIVVAIHQLAFANCQCLKAIALPDSIVHLGDAVFTGCVQLQTLKLPRHLFHVPNNLCFMCQRLKTIEPLTTSCSDLHSWSLQTIGEQAFGFNISLERVNFPPSVQTIQAGAFEFCLSLKKVNLQNVKQCQLVSVCHRAFYSCQSLTVVGIPSTASIHTQAFAHCRWLTAIVIKTEPPERRMVPDARSLINIENEAFDGCRALRNIFVRVDNGDGNDKDEPLLSQQGKEAWLYILTLFRDQGPLDQGTITRHVRITSLYKVLLHHGAAGPLFSSSNA
mmetsp:Transcript_15682/g.43251  ORF Transcript_15682/g.43251 Transcript_15682/m.43251 type:complete len:384 (-) Transcript_15682:331-1482(-)